MIDELEEIIKKKLENLMIELAELQEFEKLFKIMNDYEKYLEKAEMSREFEREFFKIIRKAIQNNINYFSISQILLINTIYQKFKRWYYKK